MKNMKYTYMIAFRLDIVVDKRTAHRVVGTTVHVATIGAFAVGLLVQLERGIRTDVLDIFVALRLAEAPGVVRVGPPGSGAARITANGQILLIPILFILQISQRWRLRHGGTGQSGLIAQLWIEIE